MRNLRIKGRSRKVLSRELLPPENPNSRCQWRHVLHLACGHTTTRLAPERCTSWKNADCKEPGCQPASVLRLCLYHKESLDWDACSDDFEGCQVEKARALRRSNGQQEKTMNTNAVKKPVQPAEEVSTVTQVRREGAVRALELRETLKEQTEGCARLLNDDLYAHLPRRLRATAATAEELCLLLGLEVK